MKLLETAPPRVRAKVTALFMLFNNLVGLGLGPIAVAFTTERVYGSADALNRSVSTVGIIVLMVVEIGLITPPVGMNVFIINSMAKDVPMKDTFKFVMPFLASDLIRISVIVFAPSIVLFVLKL